MEITGKAHGSRSRRPYLCKNLVPRTPRHGHGIMRIDELEQAVRLVMEEAKAGDEDAAWRGVQSLLREQHVQESVALALAAILEGAHLPTEKALTVLAEVYGAHRGNESVIGPLGSDKHVVMGRIAAPR